MKFHVSHGIARPEHFGQLHCQHSLRFTTIWVMQPHGRVVAVHSYSPLLGGLFKLENATTLAFYKLKFAFPANVSKLGIGKAVFSGTFSFQQYHNKPNLKYIYLIFIINECACHLCISYDTSSATVRLVHFVTSVKTSSNFPEFHRSARIIAAIVWIFFLLWLHSPMFN